MEETFDTPSASEQSDVATPAPVGGSAARAARLEDVAARVGVSRSEVSRVLNNRQRVGRSVGRAKVEEILRVAEEIGYQPNRAAQNLARGKTDTVALAVQIDASRQLSPHYQEIVGALTYTLNEWGLHLLLAQADGDQTATLTHLARTRLCDAVIITDIQVEDARPALLKSLGLPFVIRGSAPRPGLVAVGMDNEAVGYRAMQFLHGLGHRRILFHNIGRGYLSGQRRWEGFQKAAHEFGLEASARYEDQVYGEEGLYDFTCRLLARPDPPTAIFAADELAASGVLRALSDRGVSVPEQMSVLTCLNARFMRRLNPRLSVLNVRQHEVASEAGRTLAQILRGEPVEAKQTFLPPLLEDNGSCAPPATS